MRPKTEREAVERLDGGDDETAALDELIRIMVRREPDGVSTSMKLRRDEFVCRSCHMVHHQSRLADVRRLECTECVGGLARRRR